MLQEECSEVTEGAELHRDRLLEELQRQTKIVHGFHQRAMSILPGANIASNEKNELEPAADDTAAPGCPKKTGPAWWVGLGGSSFESR